MAAPDNSILASEREAVTAGRPPPPPPIVHGGGGGGGRPLGGVTAKEEPLGGGGGGGAPPERASASGAPSGVGPCGARLRVVARVGALSAGLERPSKPGLFLARSVVGGVA